MPAGLAAQALAPGACAFTVACSGARRHGGGSLFWVRSAEVLDLAVVLESDEPLRRARRAVCLGMLALAEALAATAPAECRLRLRWPATLLANGRVVGGARLAWPDAAAEHAAPAWLVFGAHVRLARPPGLDGGPTTLADQGFDAHTPQLVALFARHLARRTDQWLTHGFEAVGEAYGRLLSPPGRVDSRGDLVQGKFPLAAKLLVPEWLDAAWLEGGGAESGWPESDWRPIAYAGL